MELGARSWLRGWLCQRPTASSRGLKGGPGLAPMLPLCSLRAAWQSLGKEVKRRMSARRRWRIAWVRRSLGPPVRRAVVLPRARLAD